MRHSSEEGVRNESQNQLLRLLEHCAFGGGGERTPHPEFVPGDVGKVVQEGKKNKRTKWPDHVYESLNASLVGVPTLVVVELLGAGRACSSWGSCCAGSSGSPAH